MIVNIAVVGLGLIGGSFCKAIKKYTDHRIFGIDTDETTLAMALEQGAIHQAIEPKDLGEMDFTIVSLHPRQTIAFIKEHARQFKPGSLVADTCGVKQSIVEAVTEPLAQQGVLFVGCHPMAGREFSGFAYSLDNLFDNASFIMTPPPETPAHIIEFFKYFAQKLQFGKIVVSTPEEHDRVIAFTSQLAHVVSNAYIKSPSLEQEAGFSAGSFLDLTRVAKLNEDMWTDLFLMNRKALLFELDTIIEKLGEYRDAMEQDDGERLKQLLRDGRIRKEKSAANHRPQ
jgi:prephenate dehydrogenase